MISGDVVVEVVVVGVVGGGGGGGIVVADIHMSTCTLILPCTVHVSYC